MRPPEDGAVSESRNVYLRFKATFGGNTHRSADARKRAVRDPSSSTPFGGGRDPRGLGEVMDSLTSKLGWDSPLAKSELLASWESIVGTETAEHSHPAGIEEGVLAVRCDSTAWATQLRLMRVQILNLITSRYPEAGVNSLRFEGPGAPSWKRGPRSVPGRGPRDTYG